MADPVNQVVRFADKALRFCIKKDRVLNEHLNLR